MRKPKAWPVNEGLEAAASPLPTDPERVASFPGSWWTTAPVPNLRARSAFRQWRWFVGVGCAIMSIIALWMMAARIVNKILQ